METDRFDALTARLAQGFTRRSLGLLAALGATASLATDAGARKRHKKHGKQHGKKPRPQPCGGACGACEACFNDACVQVVDGTACSGGGTCFGGACRTCPSGQVVVDGLCATPCATFADCAAGSCLKMANHNDANVNDTRRFCVITDGAQGGATMPHCENGASSDCPSGMLCIDYATAIRCAPPA